MHESKDYKIVNVEPTNFEPDNYGNRFWSIDVDGHNGRLLWKTKNEPERGQVVYGHLEMSKSGKSMLFKKDKKEDGGFKSGGHESKSSGRSSAKDENRSKEIIWSICVKEAAEYVSSHSKDKETPEDYASSISSYANALYRNVLAPMEERVQELMSDGDTLPNDDDVDKPVELSEIPF